MNITKWFPFTSWIIRSRVIQENNSIEIVEYSMDNNVNPLFSFKVNYSEINENHLYIYVSGKNNKYSVHVDVYAELYFNNDFTYAEGNWKATYTKDSNEHSGGGLLIVNIEK